MWRGTVKVLAASAVYFAVHSALANDWTKAQAADLFGQRAADAWYRPDTERHDYIYTDLQLREWADLLERESATTTR